MPPGEEVQEATGARAGRPTTETRRRPWVRRTTGVAVALAALGSAYAFARSPFFALHAIHVAGIRHVSEGRVIRDSGLAPGQNVLWLDAGAIEARVQRDPWIETATVTRSLPRTVTIRVVERFPVAALEQGGTFAIVSADGVALATVDRAPSLPLIRAAGAARQPAASSAGPLEALAALDPKTRAGVAAASMTPEGLVVLRLRSGTRVMLGRATDLSEKADVLAGVIDYARQHRLVFVEVDVRYPAAPRAQLADGSTMTP